MICLTVQAAVASEWKVHPSLSIGEIYTDNVTLQTTTGEEYEFITDVSPGISIEKEGSRLSLDAEYLMQNLFYAVDGSRNNINHKLQAEANAQPIREHLFVDAEAVMRQVLISPEEAISIGGLNPDARVDSVSYSVSPYYRHNFNNLAETLVRYKFYEVTFEEGASDSITNLFEANLNSGRRFTQMQWRMNYRNSKMDREIGGDDNRESAFGEVRYHVFSGWSVLAQGGYENNEFASSRPIQDGTYWAVGLGWRPSNRLSIDALYGDSFKTVSLALNPTVRTSLNVSWRDSEVGTNIGQVWSGNFQLKNRRTLWEASYLEDTTTTQQLALAGTAFIFFDPSTGKVVANPLPGQTVTVLPVDVFALTDEVFLRKRGETSFAYQASKSRLFFSLFHERRVYELQGTDTLSFGGNASWNWHYSGHTTSVLSAACVQTSFHSTNRETGLCTIDEEISRQLSPHLRGSLAYRYTIQDSSGSDSDYDENRVSFRLTMRY